jgi:hypothetical protein
MKEEGTRKNNGGEEMERTITKMGKMIVHDISYRTDIDCNA